MKEGILVCSGTAIIRKKNDDVIEKGGGEMFPLHTVTQFVTRSGEKSDIIES
ncbi:MAG TPA: hypothetical protein VIX18_04230 [Nitrospirota bacterium]